MARGIRFRRARVVSEPLAPFIRFEHFITDATNIAAGEDVRLAAAEACLGPLPFRPTTYWLFDDRLVRFHYFSGDGDIVEDELV